MSNWPNQPELSRPAAPPRREGIGPAPEPRRRRGLSVDIILMTIAGALALAYGVKALSSPSAEISEWHYAAALEKWADGNRAQAIASLGNAIEWNGAEPFYYMQRAEWLRQTEGAEAALQDIDTAIAKFVYNPSLLAQRAAILQHLGRFAEASKLLQTIVKNNGASVGPNASTLNGLAYARALAKEELDQASSEIDQALKLAPNEPALLDTRGFILYRQGKFSEALADLDAAVHKGEKELQENPLSQETGRRQLVDSRGIDEALASVKRTLAVMIYHRSLALEALGRSEEAAADVERAHKLAGKAPDETLF